MNTKPDLHLISFRKEFEILDGLPHACLLPVRSVLPLPVLITSLARLLEASHSCLLVACRILDIRLSKLW